MPGGCRFRFTCQTATLRFFTSPWRGEVDHGRARANMIGRGEWRHRCNYRQRRSPHPVTPSLAKRASADDPPPPGEGRIKNTLSRSRGAPWRPSYSTPRYESPSNVSLIFAHDLIRKPQRHFSGSCGKKGRGAPFGASTGNRIPAAEGRKPASDAASTIALPRNQARDAQSAGALALRRSTAVMRRRF
jgi:hypothetical protein